MLDATKPEPSPSGDGQDVGKAAGDLLAEHGFPEVAADLEARVQWGASKYGTRLKTHNGRNALMDAYQEALDGLNYSTQAHLEGLCDEVLMFVFMNAAVNIKRKLNGEA